MLDFTADLSRCSPEEGAALQRLVSYLRTQYALEEARDKECVRFRRGGKTLVTLLWLPDGFSVMVILGKAERDKFEAVRSGFSQRVQEVYDASHTYHDGKWMRFDHPDLDLIREMARLLALKRKPNPRLASPCGFRCDLCAAYAPNVEKEDLREALHGVWKKYYGLDIASERMRCDGCRCIKKDARALDAGCPVKRCEKLADKPTCAACAAYPCSKFLQREGMDREAARQALGEAYREEEFTLYLDAYDNRWRMDGIKE